MTPTYLFDIGPYKVIKKIGQGGMGEVFLAFDPRCCRRIALKRIRPDLQTNPNVQAFFLHEAHLTAQLVHPSIVPIYEIVSDPESTYYTMAYIEGTPLDRLIAEANRQENTQSLSSLPTLLHAFLQICHAVSYAHSKGFIHRDLKPSNMMITPQGDAVILDWGIAKMKQELLSNDEKQRKEVDKVTGTVSYIAPEQAYGEPADSSSELYALGLILYEILALRHPFHRKRLDQYRRNLELEVLLDPAKVAPNRGISPILSMIVLKCLASHPNERYQSVDELLGELQNYLQQHDAWLQAPALDLITADAHPLESKLRQLSSSHHSLSVSKQGYADLLKITFQLQLGENSTGIAILLGIPQTEAWKDPQRCTCLWLASDKKRNTTLLSMPEKEIPIDWLHLNRAEIYTIQIEKIDNTLRFYLNNELQFIFNQSIPLPGTHVGFWNDLTTKITQSKVYIGGQAFNPDPLAAANALFSHGYYDDARNAYHEIASRLPFFERRTQSPLSGGCRSSRKTPRRSGWNRIEWI